VCAANIVGFFGGLNMAGAVLNLASSVSTSTDVASLRLFPGLTLWLAVKEFFAKGGFATTESSFNAC
jgi:hypothetical protein